MERDGRHRGGKNGFSPYTVPVLLADAEPLFLQGLERIVNALPGISHAGSASTLAALEADLRSCNQPVLIASGFVLACGHDLFRISRLADVGNRGARILGVVPPFVPSLLSKLKNQPGLSLISRRSGPEIWASAFEALVEGKRFLDAGIVSESPHPESTVGNANLHKLSTREREVFRLFGQNKSCRDIAAILGLSRKTVEVHRANIKEKLGIRSVKSLNLVAQASSLFESTGLDHFH